MVKDNSQDETGDGLRLEQALRDYHEVIAKDEPFDMETFLREHTEVAEDLREYIAADQSIDAALADGTRETWDSATQPYQPFQLAGYEVDSSGVRVGGMGAVYRARQLSLKRDVALKVVSSVVLTPEALRRFHNETEAVGRLQHPHVIEIFERGDFGGRPFFIMEYMEGGSLAEKLSREPMAPEAGADLIRTLAQAVHYCHNNGVMHRDLKPSNVLFTKAGAPKLGDFGLAKIFDDDADRELTRTHQVLGTANYMAPEQAWGKVVGRDALVKADIYALGAILYRILAGRPPFRGKTHEGTLDLARNQRIVRPSRIRHDLCPVLEAICLKCLARSPQQRYASAEELAEDLRRWQANEKTIAGGERIARRRKFTFGWTIVAASIALLSLAVGGHLRSAYTSYSMNSRLLGEGRVTLLPATGKPLWYQVSSRDSGTRVTFHNDKPCQFQAKDAAVVYLMKNFRHERFRITAEIRHDSEDPPDGGVGLFIAREDEDGIVEQPRGCLVRFSDHADDMAVWEAGKSLWEQAKVPVPPPPPGNRLNLYGYVMLQDSKNLYSENHYFRPDPNGRWRTLGLEVHPEVIYVNWGNDLHVIQLSAAQTHGPREAKNGAAVLNHQGRQSLRLGIYVRSGSAAFRNVTVNLLPRVIDRLGD